MSRRAVSLEAHEVHRDIILFGGTFEPPHIGHLLMARVALEQTEAEEVWFIPALAPPHKDEVRLDFSVRKTLVEALIQDTPGLSCSDIESGLPKPSYTVDTVRAVKARYPRKRFTFLIGTDSLAALPQWYRADELCDETSFLVAARTGYPFLQTYESARASLPNLEAMVVEMPIVDLSSTWLRARLRTGQPMCGLVPDAVLDLWRRATKV